MPSLSHPAGAPPSTSTPQLSPSPGAGPAGRALGGVRVRPITPAEHRRVLLRHPDASFLQTPAWGRVKTHWRAESVGFELDGRIAGAALVLYRRLPVPAAVPFLGSACLAYVAEGPVLDDDVPLEAALTGLVAHVRAAHAFELRLGLPGVVRRWSAESVRHALRGDGPARLADVPHEVDPDRLEEQELLRALGFRAPAESTDFAAGQPSHQARIPLEVGVDAVLARMNQTSRSETRRSRRTGLTILRGGAELLPAFHALYTETAEREHFTGRPASYFTRLLSELAAEAALEVDVLVAEHEGDPLAAAIAVRQGHMAWYPYGGSTTRERRLHAPRALQLEQITAAVESGRRWYDLGGVAPSLHADHKLIGLMRFKTAMGADVVQTHGEWTLPLNGLLSRAFHRRLDRS